MSCYWPPRNINLAAQNKTNWRSAQPSQKNKKKSQTKMGVRRWFSRFFFSRKKHENHPKNSKSKCRSNFKGVLLFRLCSLSLESDNTLACSPSSSSSSKHSTQHSTYTHKKYKCQKKHWAQPQKLTSFSFLFFSFQKNRKKGDREGETGETRETERERDRRERTGRRLSPGTTKVPSFSTCTHSMLACLCVCVCVASLPSLSLF